MLSPEVATPSPLMLSPPLMAVPPPAAKICGPQFVPHQLPVAVISLKTSRSTTAVALFPTMHDPVSESVAPVVPLTV